MNFEDFVNLFNGRDQIGSNGEFINMALDHLSVMKNYKKCMYACIVFSEKPKSFLMTGRTKSGKGDSNGALDSKIAQYLPMLGHVPPNRAWMPVDFQSVNFSMIRTIYFLTLEFYIKGDLLDMVDNCRRSRGGKIPSEMILTKKMLKDNERSVEIYEEQLAKFLGGLEADDNVRKAGVLFRSLR